jgi:hypothetical protein
MIARQRPREAFRTPDAADEQLAARGRPPEEGWAVATADVPTRALNEATAPGLDPDNPRPPIRKPLRVRDQSPDILARREEQARG